MSLIVPEERIVNSENPEERALQMQQHKAQCASERVLLNEYAHVAKMLRNGDLFPKLTQEDKLKVENLIKYTYMSMRASQYTAQGSVLPLNVYGQGWFHDAARAKVQKPDQQDVRNLGHGIMRSSMPLPPEDEIVTSQKPFPILSPPDRSDQAHFSEAYDFAHKINNTVVHPFVNSISGTSLTLVRALAGAIEARGKPIEGHEGKLIANYLTLAISAMAHSMGGHSLYEFTEPLMIPEVSSVLASWDVPPLNLETMFLTGNEEAFERALTATIVYAENLALKKQLHAEIGAARSPDPSPITEATPPIVEAPAGEERSLFQP